MDPTLDIERWIQFEQQLYSKNATNTIKAASVNSCERKPQMIQINTIPTYLITFQEKLLDTIYYRVNNIYNLNDKSLIYDKNNQQLSNLRNIDSLLKVSDLTTLLKQIDFLTNVEQFSPFQSLTEFKQYVDKILGNKHKICNNQRFNYYKNQLKLQTVTILHQNDTETIMNVFSKAELAQNLKPQFKLFVNQIQKQLHQIYNFYYIIQKSLLQNRQMQVFPSSAVIQFENISNIIGLINYVTDEKQVELFIQLHKFYFNQFFEIGYLTQFIGIVIYILKNLNTYQLFQQLQFDVFEYSIRQLLGLLSQLPLQQQLVVLDLLIQNKSLFIVSIIIASILHHKALFLINLLQTNKYSLEQIKNGGQLDKIMYNCEELDVISLLEQSWK